MSGRNCLPPKGANMFIDIHAHAYRADCPPADGHTKFATPDEVIKRYDASYTQGGK